MFVKRKARHTMDTVQQLLNSKGVEVHKIEPDQTVFDAIEKMANLDIGSLVVTENGKPVGIFTERHYARNIALRGKQSPTTLIKDVMNKRIVYASRDQTVEECMAVMIDQRIRHLPVVEKGKLIGIISIGDLVKSRIAEQEFTIEQLANYIHG